VRVAHDELLSEPPEYIRPGTGIILLIWLGCRATALETENFCNGYSFADYTSQHEFGDPRKKPIKQRFDLSTGMMAKNRLCVEKSLSITKEFALSGDGEANLGLALLIIKTVFCMILQTWKRPLGANWLHQAGISMTLAHVLKRDRIIYTSSVVGRRETLC
jgi:hypothetical protein